MLYLDTCLHISMFFSSLERCRWDYYLCLFDVNVVYSMFQAIRYVVDPSHQTMTCKELKNMTYKRLHRYWEHGPSLLSCNRDIYRSGPSPGSHLKALESLVSIHATVTCTVRRQVQQPMV